MKLRSTPLAAMAAGIKAFRKDFGAAVLTGYAVYPNPVSLLLKSVWGRLDNIIR